MTVTLGEIPEIAGTVIDDLDIAFGINDRDLAMAVDNIGPFGGIVPMHLARAARIHEEMRARDVGCDWKRAVMSRAQPPDVALIGPLSRAAVKVTGSPDLRGIVLR